MVWKQILHCIRSIIEKKSIGRNRLKTMKVKLWIEIKGH